MRIFAACTCAVLLAAPAIQTQSTRRPVSAGVVVRDFDIMEKSIPDLQRAMEAGSVTSHQLTAIYLARIQAYDKAGPRLNAMLAVNPRVLDAADALDRDRAAGRLRGPLHGIPIVIKDNFETADMPTTAGSLALVGFETERDAFQVKKLRDAGAVIVGKTNLHELASGITTISSLGGQTLNPYDLDRTPGGSSGGTGAAVAANFAVAGMGSDTCGSIRIPAANNNLFGLRGTSGLSSRAGIVPLSHTQDIGGPLARTVTDLAIMLDATVGVDPADSTTARSSGHVPRSYRDALTANGLTGVRIGVLKQLFGTAPEDDEVGRIVRNAIDAIKKAGADTMDVNIPGLDEQMQGSSVINAEFKFDLADYLAGHRAPPVHSLTEILDSGRYHASLDANFKTRNRPEQRDTDEYPAIIGEPQRGTNCQLSPSTGLPVVAMPAGFADGVPVGVELLGGDWSEPALLKMAYAYEQATRPRRPPFSAPALINGVAPAPVTFQALVGGATARFTYDRTSTHLAYVVTAQADTLAVTLHRGADGEKGPVVARLADGTGTTASGDIRLGAMDREALEGGRLYLEVAVKHQPAGSRAQVRVR